MSLPRPLRRLVAAAPPDDAVDRMWHAIDARRAPPRRPRVLALGVAFAAAAAVFLVLRPAPAPAPAPEPVLALLLSDGQPLPAQLAPSTHLSDGSTIALTAAHLDVLETDATHATFLLRDGRAHFDVVPNGPRRWVIECGLAVVEVVGTSFTIDRTPTTVTVTVDHGVVLVRSPHLPDGIRRLTATQSLSVSAPEPEPEPEPVLSPTPPSALPPSALPPSALPPSASSLLASADALRRRGDLPGAAAVLARVIALPDEPLAALAAYTRANIHEELGDPTAARADLRRALTLGLPPALAARARARLKAAP